MKDVVHLDTKAGHVTVQAGISYGELCPYLHKHGFALQNLASLPHISIAGAVCTATHGSGRLNGNLATAVCGLRMVTGSGEVVHLTEESTPQELAAAVVGLGSFGIVVELTLKMLPCFTVRRQVFTGLYLGALSPERFASVMGVAYSVSLFTSWRPKQGGLDSIEFHVWIMSKISSAEAEMEQVLSEQSAAEVDPLRGCTASEKPLHPVEGMDPTSCTDQFVVGPWHERLPHFRLDQTPSAGNEVQSEYFVALEDAADALHALGHASSHFEDLLLVSEIRSISADQLLLSPHSARHGAAKGSVGIHFTWQPRQDEVMARALPIIEKTLAPYHARPHWGKLFVMSALEIKNLYGDALVEFKELAQCYDPAGKFYNSWVEEKLGCFHHVMHGETTGFSLSRL